MKRPGPAGTTLTSTGIAGKARKDLDENVTILHCFLIRALCMGGQTGRTYLRCLPQCLTVVHSLVCSASLCCLPIEPVCGACGSAWFHTCIHMLNSRACLPGMFACRARLLYLLAARLRNSLAILARYACLPSLLAVMRLLAVSNYVLYLIVVPGWCASVPACFLPLRGAYVLVYSVYLQRLGVA